MQKYDHDLPNYQPMLPFAGLAGCNGKWLASLWQCGTL